jgi:hypothetical protein
VEPALSLLSPLSRSLSGASSRYSERQAVQSFTGWFSVQRCTDISDIFVLREVLPYTSAASLRAWSIPDTKARVSKHRALSASKLHAYLLRAFSSPKKTQPTRTACRLSFFLIMRRCNDVDPSKLHHTSSCGRTRKRLCAWYMGTEGVTRTKPEKRHVAVSSKGLMTCARIARILLNKLLILFVLAGRRCRKRFLSAFIALE